MRKVGWPFLLACVIALLSSTAFGAYNATSINAEERRREQRHPRETAGHPGERQLVAAEEQAGEDQQRQHRQGRVHGRLRGATASGVPGGTR